MTMKAPDSLAAAFVTSNWSILQINAPSSVVNCTATIFVSARLLSITDPPLADRSMVLRSHSAILPSLFS
jgi:hypothetical protein